MVFVGKQWANLDSSSIVNTSFNCPKYGGAQCRRDLQYVFLASLSFFVWLELVALGTWFGN